MTVRPALLQTSAALLWATTAVTLFTGFDDEPQTFSAVDERLWLCTLGLSLIATWAAVQQALVVRFAKSNQALATAVLSRPVNDDRPMLIDVTGPHAVLSQPASPPADLRAARRRQLAQRAKR